jgi:hypothetical protein
MNVGARLVLARILRQQNDGHRLTAIRATTVSVLTKKCIHSVAPTLIRNRYAQAISAESEDDEMRNFPERIYLSLRADLRFAGLCMALLLGLLMISVSQASGQYVSADSYTRYELLAPDTHQFRIYYEVTETRPGARFHFNPIREGSTAIDESVIDAATAKPLKFEVVTGAQARSDSPDENLNPTAHYIKVHLAHPVAAAGEYRLIIWKTYKDEQSYYTEGDTIVFKRSLGIARNSVVLPAGFEVVSSSVATQILMEADGRLKLAFVNPGSGGALEATIKARRLPSAKKAEGTK